MPNTVTHSLASKSKIPVTLVTGFLGSGKTTIIGHLIDDLIDRGVKVVYVKNEIGDQDLDGAILKGKHIQTRELLNGCICCTLVGPFLSAIDELIGTTQPDRIIIEASGTAETASLALMIASHPRVTRDAVITVIDVLNYEGAQDLSETTRHQAQFTDLLVFNKVELADLEQKQRVVGYVRETNEASPIVEAPQGHLNLDLAIGISSESLEKELAQFQLNEHHHGETFEDHHDATHVHNHVTEDHIEAWSYFPKGNLDQAKLATILTQIPKAIFRIKGVFQNQAGEWQIINRIGQRTTFDLIHSASVPKLQAKIIFIGFHAPDLADTLSEFMSQCDQSN